MAGSTQGIRAGRAFVELFADDSQFAKGLHGAEKRLRMFGSAVSGVGSQLTKLGTAALAPLAGSAKVAADFESEMARVQALTGATGDDFDKLKGKAKQLGRDTVFMATDAAKAMSTFALAGFKVNDILTAIGPTLDLAAAGQLDVATASDIATKVIYGMGLSVDDFKGAVDVMTKAMTTANTDLLLLGEAFKYVGPVAKSAGLSFEETTAAIQLLSNAGIQGDMAGTTLRGMLLTLVSPSQEAADGLAALGVRTTDAKGNFLGLVPVIRQLEKSLGGLGSGDKLGKLGKIFPDRQAAGAAELLAQGANRLAAATADLGDSAGTASRIAGRQLDTLLGSFKILVSSLEYVGIEIGEALTPTLRGLSSNVVMVLNAISNLVKENRTWIVTFGKAALAITAVGGSLVAVGVAISVAGSLFGAIATAVTTFGAAMGFVGSALAAVLSPVGLITAGLVAGVAAFFAYSDAGGQAIAFLGNQFRWLQGMVAQAFAGIADAIAAGDLTLATQILWAGLKVEWLKGVAYLKGIWADWGTAFAETASDASYAISGIMIDLVDGVRAIWAELMAGLSGSWGDLIKTLLTTLNPLAQALKLLGVDVEGLVQQGLDLAGLGTTNGAQDVLAAIGSENMAKHQSLADQQAAETAARRQAAQDSVAGSQADLAKAQRELDAKTREASIKRNTVTGIVGEGAAPGGPGSRAVSTVGGMTEDIGQAVEKAAAKVDVAGTFNALGAAGLGAGSTLGENQLKEAKKQTVQLEKANRKLDQVKGAFT